MKDLFDRLRIEKFAVIEELVRDRYQETVQLDFKTKENAKNGELSKNDRSVLGLALSALANSAGGLLIWGIEARKDPVDGIDAAQAKVPISDLARFSSEVTRAVGQLLSPKHDGIEPLAIDDPNQTGAGYVAIWVERSPRRPHMSIAANDKRYYKRAGDSSFIMEHYDVEDSFNRKAPAELRLALTDVQHQPSFSRAKEGGTIERLTLLFCLVNEDQRSGCAPFVSVAGVLGGKIELALPKEQSDFKLTEYPDNWMFTSSGSFYIHPGMSVPVFVFVVDVVRQVDAAFLGRARAHETSIYFEYAYGCQDAKMKRGKWQLVGSDLEDFVDAARKSDRLRHQPEDYPATG